MKKNLQFMIALCCAVIGTQTSLFGYTDDQVSAFTADQVHALTQAQIRKLTPTQLLVVLPNFLNQYQGWCPFARKGTTCMTRDGKGWLQYHPSQYTGIADQQIYDMTKAQLTGIPQKIYNKLYQSKGAAVTYALAHNS